MLQNYRSKGVLAVFALILLSGFAIAQGLPFLPTVLTIQTEGQPTIGKLNSSVEVVVFEEPKCPACKRFSEIVYPQIKKNYLDTDKIRYTMIPVSFLPLSMPAAEAWLCVYHQVADHPNSALFFNFVETTYAKQPEENSNWATPDNLEKIAKQASPLIDTEALKACLSKETYKSQIEKNTKYGNTLMKGRLTTPSIFVNGVKVENPNYAAVSRQIELALKAKD